jgi:hypothetical protein
LIPAKVNKLVLEIAISFIGISNKKREWFVDKIEILYIICQQQTFVELKIINFFFFELVERLTRFSWVGIVRKYWFRYVNQDPLLNLRSKQQKECPPRRCNLFANRSLLLVYSIS